MIFKKKVNIPTISVLLDPNDFFYQTIYTGKEIVDTPRKAFKIFRKNWNQKTINRIENHMTLYLTDNFEIIGLSLDSIGNKNSCEVNPCKIINCAKLFRANYIITAHNHPSGLGTPSFNDIISISQIKKDLKSYNITLLEHIILSKSKQWYYSFALLFIV